MSGLQQVIIIGDCTSQSDFKEKVILYDPQEGRASKRQLCIYSTAWLLLSIIAPLWMASIAERPYSVLVPPPAQTGLTLIPSSPCIHLEDCGLYATSFNVSLVANLEYAPPTAYPPVIFASVSHPNPQWWVAAVASSPLSDLIQYWEIFGGCFGAAGGKLYLVACLPAEGRVFTQGEQIKGPPFDDRCSAIGTWCGGSCSSVINPSHCDGETHEILPLPDSQSSIFANNSALPAGSYIFSTHASGLMTTIFVFFTTLSVITFLLNHCAPVAAFLEGFGKTEEEIFRKRCPPLDKIKHKHKEISVAVVSIFCYEKAFHITRNLIGVACSWNTLAKVTQELGFAKTRVVHYVVDNSKSKNDCMPALVAKFIHFCNENPNVDWDAVMRGLQNAPFEPTPFEYSSMLPASLRNTINSFLAELGTGDREYFDPFSPSGPEVAKDPITDVVIPPLLSEVVRLPSENRSKVAALQECGKLFHNFRKETLGFLAIMDARHMMTPTFWQYSLPAFFVQGSKLGILPRNESASESREYFENTCLRLTQVMQHFPIVNSTEDYFDRGNFFNYLYSNALRNQIQSVTSCGTNALWSMRDYPTGAQFNFSGKTLIEDTETSHAFMSHGETSTYISKGLVHGSVKNPEDYGEAPSRWAAGAIQLLFSQPSFIKFIVASLLLYFALPLCISLLVTHVRRGEWVMLAAWSVCVLCIFAWHVTTSRTRFAAQAIIRIVNTTYWLTGPLTAVFWMVFVPSFILITGTLPFHFNAEAMMAGGLVVSMLQWIMVIIAKRCAKACEMHLWRSQQAWFALWPLNFLGIPRLLNPNTAWQISTIQAKVTLCVNACEVVLLCVALLCGLFSAHVRIATVTGTASLLIGCLYALYALSLLIPTTSYLFNSILFNKRHPYNISSRHILGGFLVICLVLYVAYSPDWALAFSQFFALETPSLFSDSS